MGRIPEAVVEEIKEKIDFLALVGEHTSLKPKGGRYWGCCPFHNERTPSFTVTPEEGMFYCFGCQKGGSLFNFIMEVEGIGFGEALRVAAERAGVPLEDYSGNDREEDLRRNSLKEVHRRLAGSFHHILMETPQGGETREYLARRGIHKESIEKFQLGYAPTDPQWLYSFLQNHNYSPELLRGSGLFSQKSPRWPLFVDRLMFPIYSSRGEVVAFSGRKMGNAPQAPKYINSPDTSLYSKGKQLYGFWQSRESLRQNKTFYLCEGNLDVIALHQAGISSAVAPLGTGLTEGQVHLLKRYSKGGVLLFDGDEAGQRASYKAGILFESQEIPVQAVGFPSGRDPADILEREGPKTLKKLVESPINLFEYLLGCTVVSNGGTDSLEGKEQVARGLFPYINSIVSEIRRDLSLDMLAQELGLSKKAVLGELHRHQGNSRPVPLSRRATGKQEKKVTDELLLVIAVALHGEFLERLQDYHRSFDFHDMRAESLYHILIEERGGIEHILQRIEDDDLKRLVLERLSSGELKEAPQGLIQKNLKLLKLRNLRQRSQEINTAIEGLSQKENSWELLRELIQEQQVLSQEINLMKEGCDVGSSN